MYQCVINIYDPRLASGLCHVSQLQRAGSCVSYRPASSVHIWTHEDIQLFFPCRHTLKYDEDEVRAGQRGHLRDSLGVKCDLRVTSPGERKRDRARKMTLPMLAHFDCPSEQSMSLIFTTGCGTCLMS